MAYTWVGICNMALRRVGAAPITALTDKPSGLDFSAIYQEAVDEIISENRELGWSDARKRTALAVDSTAPDSVWLYRYLLPASPYCLTLVEVIDVVDWELEGRYIQTNAETPINIVYDQRISDPTNISPHLAVAIAARISEKIVYRLVQDKTLREAILRDAERDILRARGLDAIKRKGKSQAEKGGYSWVERLTSG